LTALPGATILELGAHGIRPTQWSELDLVRHWRDYLGDPQAYLKRLLAQ
jgi:predicted ATPase